MTPPLDIGIGVPPRPPLARVVAVAAAAREAGASTLWCIDHFTSFVPQSVWGPEFSPQAEPGSSPDEIFEFQALLGFLAAIQPGMGVAVGVTEAIRRHPVLLAQTALTMTHLGAGRVILGIGAGERENTEPYGFGFSRPVGRLEEALEVLRLCFERRGPFDFAGEHFALRQAIMDLPPGPAGVPEIWVAAHGPRTRRLTGRFGDGWYPTIPMTPEEYAGNLAEIKVAAADAGRDPEAITPAMQMFLASAPTDADAAALLDTPPVRLLSLLVPASEWRRRGFEHPLGDFRGMVDFVPQHYDRTTAMAAIASVPDEMLDAAVIAGSADSIVARVQALAAAGMRHVMFSIVPGLPPPPPDAPHSALQITRRLVSGSA